MDHTSLLIVLYFQFSGSFELAVLRMSRFYDLSQNCVLFGDTLLPEDTFYTNDNFEIKLVRSAFEVSRNVAELKLTEVELALYSAFVLLSPGKFPLSLFSFIVSRSIIIKINKFYI